eukprot:Lithocolla_globosa_v1_NODE_125_length_6057_cov_666.534322.p2 type:complete len:681 gc:universal NODE_125_length_6057_cov_666.534322:5564-3522(-)
MRGVVSLETNFTQVLLNVLGRQSAAVHTHRGFNLGVNVLHVLVATHLFQLLAVQPRVITETETNPGDFILEITARRGTTLVGHVVKGALDFLNITVGVRNVQGNGLGQLSLLLFSNHHGLLDEGFLVLTKLVTPSNVLVGSLLQVLLNVMESVLGNVGNTKTVVRPDGTLLRDQFTGQDLDHGRLTSTVHTDDTNTRGQRDTDGDIHDGGLVIGRVSEGNVVHLHDSLTLGVNTLQETRFGEFERVLGRLELEERLGSGVQSNEGLEVTLVCLELQVLNLQDVGAAVVQQAGVVGNHDAGGLGQRVEVVLDPSNVEGIQVVSGFIQQQNVSLLQHGTRQSELHSPTTREGSDGITAVLLVETNSLHDSGNFFTGNVGGRDTRILENVLEARQVRHFSLNISFNEDGTEFVREALQLTNGHGAHQTRFTGIVSTQKTITMTTLETERGVVQKNLGTVGQSKLEVTESFTIIIAFIVNNLGEFLALFQQTGRGGLGLGFKIGTALQVGLEERHHGFFPHRQKTFIADNLVLNQSNAQVTEVSDQQRLRSVRVVLLLKVTHDSILHTVQRQIEGNNLGLHVLQVVTDTFHHTTGFGVRGGFGGSFQKGQQVSQKGGGFNGFLNELGQVLNDNGSLTFHGNRLVTEGTSQKRFDNAKSTSINFLNKSGRGQLVDSVGNFLQDGH